MSLDALKWAWKQDLESPLAKVVLLALAERADGRGVCWPGVAHIAAMTGCGERTVQRHLRSLETKGLVKRQHRARADGSMSSYYYHLQMRERPHSHPGGAPESHPNASESHPLPVSHSPTDATLSANEGVIAAPGAKETPAPAPLAGGVAPEGHQVVADGHGVVSAGHPSVSEPPNEPYKEPLIVNQRGEEISLSQLWERVKRGLSLETTKLNCSFLEGTQLIACKDRQENPRVALLTVQCPSDNTANWLDRYLKPLLTKKASQHVGREVHIEFVGKDEGVHVRNGL